MKFKKPLFLGIILAAILGLTIVRAEPNCDDPNIKLSADDAQYCADKISREIATLAPAHEKNKKDLAALNSQISALKKKIESISSQLKRIEKEIFVKEDDLAFTKALFEEKTASHYRLIRTYDPITPFLISNSASQAFREAIYRQRAAEGDKKAIETYVGEINKLRKDKESLEKTKVSLDSSKKSLDEKAKFLGAEVAKVESYLATLSAKQQAFLAQKLESLGLSRSAYNMRGGCSSDINPFKSPGFSPAFAFFTFGVPNRVGMNQYGAWGRAKAGQNEDQILRAYYNFDTYQNFEGVTIKVNNGNGINQGSVIWSGSLEDYVKRIYEVPDSWTENNLAVLKAQAIAARSYALAVTGGGASSICANEFCQVFKTMPKGGNWEAAVNATAGRVMVQAGKPITAWFSATHGGYAYTSVDIGWRSTPWTKRLIDASGDVRSFSDLMNNAYDKSSPVFYCDWGSRPAYNKTAWLKAEEVADIANVILLAKADGSTQKHLAQVDKPNPDGVDTWDAARVKSELRARGIVPFDSVSDIVVGADFTSGRTVSVSIDGRSFDGQEFKNYFNLRAPSNIQIVGPLFNIEKR